MPAGRRCTNPNPNLNRIYLFELKSTLLRSVIYLFIEFQKIILQLFLAILSTSKRRCIQFTSVRLILAFFLLNIRYLFALLNFCRSLLPQRIVYVHCLLVTHASSYVAYSCNAGEIFKLHSSCAMPFIDNFWQLMRVVLLLYIVFWLSLF